MIRSYTLVGIQFALIGFLGWYGGVVGNWLSNGFVITGTLLGFFAVVTMRFRFNVLPEVRSQQKLFVGGPYAFIRHPMYTAVLLVTFGWLLNRPDSISIIAWVLLLSDLLVKLGFEERLLVERFPEYPGYAARTKRLVPWVY